MRCSCHVFFLSYCGHECHGILPPVSMLMYAARCTKNKEKTASVIAQGKGRGGRVSEGSRFNHAFCRNTQSVAELLEEQARPPRGAKASDATSEPEGRLCK